VVAATVQVDIWSDVVCPWCYVGKRRFEQALARFEQRDAVVVVWHSFQLDPSAPVRTDATNVARLAAKYGMSLEQAQQANDRVTELAAAEGLEFHLDRAQHGNTFDAHRLIHLGAARGIQGEVKERLLRAYFTESRRIGDRATLVELAVDSGLDEAEAREVLDTDRYADAVRADAALASSLGITAVPFFVIDGRYAVRGAQPMAVFAQALNQAWTESRPFQVLTSAGGDGATCDDDSCAV
jgi:predicted DsbA family dithiol-disulfide isomerase